MMLAYQKLVSHIIVVAISLGFILTLPVQSIVTVNLVIVATTLTQRLYWEIRLHDHPHLKAWATSTVKTVFWVSVFYISFVIAGGLGLWGLLLMTVVLAAWRLYQGRELFDKYTTWASDRAWGKTKESFNLMEALTNEQSGSSDVIREDTHQPSRQSSGVEAESSSNPSVEQRVPASQTPVQEVPHGNIKIGKPRTSSRKGKVVRVMQKDLRTRNEVN